MRNAKNRLEKEIEKSEGQHQRESHTHKLRKARRTEGSKEKRATITKKIQRTGSARGEEDREEREGRQGTDHETSRCNAARLLCSFSFFFISSLSSLTKKL